MLLAIIGVMSVITVHAATVSSETDRDLKKLIESDQNIFIISHPEKEAKKISLLAKQYAKSTERNLVTYESLQLKSDQEVIQDLSFIISKRPQVVIYIKHGEEIPAPAQQFIKELKNNKQVTFIIGTTAGQALMQLSNQDLKQEQLQQALSLEGLQETLFNENNIITFKPVQEESMAEKIAKIIDQSLNRLNKENNGIKIVLQTVRN
jgi:hypothetical protein